MVPPIIPLKPPDFCTNTSKNGPILRIERNVSCNKALVEVIENVPMKALVYAQLQPVKTMSQFISDRCLYRMLILAMLVVNWCF